MSKFVYKKSKKRSARKAIRLTGLGLLGLGFLFGLYTLFPLLSWEVYLKPVFADQSFAAPIPKNTVITQDYIASLLESAGNSLQPRDYNKAQNWLPGAYRDMQVSEQGLSAYNLSIPKLHIENAEVGTLDTDLAAHLVHFPGTSLPGSKGTAVIFGHSTLPQWFDPKDYKAIFATAHTLKVGDAILVTADNTLYTYKIYAISIVDSSNISYLTQDYTNSYLTLVTCTPPGTTWKRLLIKAKLETI